MDKEKGLVRWQEGWVTPERAKELKEQYLENMRRSNRAMWEARRIAEGTDRWMWC